MKKIKILDTKESIKATAKHGPLTNIKLDMFGKTFEKYVEYEVSYDVCGYTFAKESCEIIDDRPILSGEPPELAYYELSNGKINWTQEAYLIIGYDKGSSNFYYNGDEWYAFARKVEL